MGQVKDKLKERDQQQLQKGKPHQEKSKESQLQLREEERKEKRKREKRKKKKGNQKVCFLFNFVWKCIQEQGNKKRCNVQFYHVFVLSVKQLLHARVFSGCDITMVIYGTSCSCVLNYLASLTVIISNQWLRQAQKVI